MLTLITGTPGAGKSLLAVWELAQPVPGSVIEQDGKAVPRRLLSNIKDLLVDHVHIDAKDLECWHTWAQPGDVILYDEVQEVWRPRGLGTKVPPEIAALETHRHMGVDLILITQHPMLVDPNIRRLVNQHLHLRRILASVAMVYEWDHCENPGNTKTCIATRFFRHRRSMYGLYKSAQLHTKPKARMPALVYLFLAMVIGLGFAMPVMYGKITSNFAGVKKETKQAEVPKPAQVASMVAQQVPTLPEVPPAALPAGGMPLPLEEKPVFSGCVKSSTTCVCLDTKGQRVKEPPDDACKAEPSKPVIDLAQYASVTHAASAPPVPPVDAPYLFPERHKPSVVPVESFYLGSGGLRLATSN